MLKTRWKHCISLRRILIHGTLSGGLTSLTVSQRGKYHPQLFSPSIYRWVNSQRNRRTFYIQLIAMAEAKYLLRRQSGMLSTFSIMSMDTYKRISKHRSWSLKCTYLAMYRLCYCRKNGWYPLENCKLYRVVWTRCADVPHRHSNLPFMMFNRFSDCLSCILQCMVKHLKTCSTLWLFCIVTPSSMWKDTSFASQQNET